MADYSAPRKSKLTKKTEKVSRLTDRSQVNLNLGELNEEKLSNEPYQCTGRLFDDFHNLCKQNQIAYIPPVLHRGKRPSTPTLTDVKTEKSRIKRGTVSNTNFDNQSIAQSDQLLAPTLSISQKQQSISTLNEQDEAKDSDLESLPKTFVLIKDRFEYFKPKIHVEVDNFEKVEMVTEVYIKGWRIDPPIMNILKEALPFSDKITSLNLWSCGLTEETFEILTSFLPKCLNLRNMALDGNPLSEENFHKLIKPESLIQHLSLRNCQITDLGAEKIGKELGTLRSQNSKLLSLNLSGNNITDKGAIEIARALRTNRTLLVLNLSGNEIGDLGACRLAETLSRFKMTHEEIVRRRTMKRERIVKELSPASRRNKTEMSEKPVSLATHKSNKESSKTGKKDRSENSASVNRDRSKSKDIPGGRESVADKQGSSKTKKEKESVASVQPAVTNLKKEKSKEPLTNTTGAQDKAVAKTLKTKGSKKTLKDSENENDGLMRSPSKLSTVFALSGNENDPLMDEVEGIDGELYLIGNRTLISLNLSRNRITLIGVKEFLSCIQVQLTMALFNRSATALGLLKLNLHKNDFPVTNEYYVKLTELIKNRDPLTQKSTEHSVDKDAMSVISKDGRETNRSKSSKMRIF